jgi:hypothetical protein
MSLSELVDNSRTDKNTGHSYLELYQSLLVSKKLSAKNILEIGICSGGSIKLWHDFFTNATIYGLDIMNLNDVWAEIKDKDRIKLHTSVDAYNVGFFNAIFPKEIKFDMILDDGPHSLESMIQCIRLYTKLLSDDGILIIEDVQDWAWIEILKNEVPTELRNFVEVYDLRPTKNRYDDIVFTINKRKLYKNTKFIAYYN